MKRSLLYFLGALCAVVSCIEEQPEFVISNPGDEVVFSAALNDGVKTRTIYGDDVIETDSNNNDYNAVMLHWVDGDLIYVYGHDCLEDRNQAEYSVTSATADDGYSYAESLTKTGAVGVQWGESETSDFFSVYPSTALYTPESGQKVSYSNGTATFNTSINSVQNNFFTFEDGVWKGAEIDVNDQNNKETLSDGIMYAYTKANRADGTVNLRFKPFSTVLTFTINGVQTPSGLTNVFVNQIDVIAPEGTNIAGKFPLNITSTSASAGTITEGSNVVSIKLYSIDTATGERQNNVYICPGEKLEFSVFTIPQANLNLTGWKVRLLTSHGTKTFTISAPDGSNAALVPGQIHRLNIAKLKNLNDDFQFNPAEWISQLPTNIYLSEISIPGSWYSTDTEHPYQVVSNGSTNLEGQYAAGVRAFNIDCRLTLAEGKNVEDYGTGSQTSASYYQYQDNIEHVTDGTLVLACAGTEVDQQSELGRPVGPIESIGMTVESAIIKLGNIISLPENQDEFVEIILTVSEKPKTRSTVKWFQDIEYRFGTINPKFVLKAIADVLNKDTVKPYLYQGHITETTTIKDVLGKIIVKVNLNTSNDNIVSYGITDGELNDTFCAPMMISSGSMVSNSVYVTGDIITGTFDTYTEPAMICGHDYNVGSLLYYNHQANGTDGSNQPTTVQRLNAIDAIIEIASTYYAEGVKAWYQLGIGGVQSGDYTTLATTMNKHVYQSVMKKMGYSFNGDALVTETIKNEDGTETTIPKIDESSQDISPVGIVLMNQCLSTSYYGPELIDAILKLNAKFYMQRAAAGSDNGELEEE